MARHDQGGHSNPASNGPPGEYEPPFREKNVFAHRSLIIAVVGFFFLGFILGPIAIILGAIGYSQIQSDPHRYSGRNRAIAGIILGMVDIIVYIAFLLFVYPVVI